MVQQHQLVIADQRQATPRLRWLTLAAPELARRVRAGHYLLVRCAEDGSYDPLLRRPLFVAAAEPALGQIGLLYAPLDRGLAWLSRGRAGDVLDIIGPLGHPFALGQRTRNLLLIGQGPGLAALLFLARAAVAKGCAVTLLAGTLVDDAQPPAFLLPDEVEYQSTAGPVTDLLNIGGVSQATQPQTGKETRRQGDKEKRKDQSVTLSPCHLVTGSSLHPIAWADQICAALPNELVPPLREAIRTIRYRWERGFASVLLEGPIICGVGACGVCTITLPKGPHTRCHDGPVFDLRDLRSEALS
jgi:dihydroorotate dehydrogenase electron transfer subunit